MKIQLTQASVNLCSNYSQKNYTTRQWHYISGGDGLTAVYIKTNETGQLYFVAKDHLGSIIGLYNTSGTLVEEYSYDAWGRRRDPVTWAPLTQTPNFLLTRGYTGHEHLDEFGLINMNGRLYDPLLGRMLSPDNYVQDASGTQNLNRYSYCNNNPVVYTDPSGDFIGFYLFGASFLGEYFGNGINDNNWDIKVAFKSANQTVKTISTIGQSPIYQDKTTLISAGLDPLAFGISLNFQKQSGDLTYNGGIGFGLMSGFFTNCGVNLSSGDWIVGVGAGTGTNNYSMGINASFMGFGVGYSNSTFKEYTDSKGVIIGSQNIGAIRILWPGGAFQIENDFFDNSKKSEDRWRTSAWELSIGNLSLGSSILTNDPKNESNVDDPYTDPRFTDLNGLNLVGKKNKHRLGSWVNGIVYSSPLWIGMRIGNNISRIGYSFPLVQDRTQNWLHRNLVYQNFYNKYSTSINNGYGFSGYYNSFTLYTR